MDYLAFLDSFTSPAVAAGVTVPSAPASRPFAPVSSALDKPGGRDDPSRIKIVVRIRPSLPGEACALPDGSSVLSCSDPTTPDGQPSVSITCPGSEPKSLTFHDVFGPSAGQTAVFEGSVLACVQSALDGVNATVFAYGCTGSGKTHTMVGSDCSGVIPQALYTIFSTLKGRDATVTASFVQIYNEDIQDLVALSPPEKLSSPALVDDGCGGVTLLGVSRHLITNASEGVGLLRAGFAKRFTAATSFNEVSSRSHAVFTIRIIQRSGGSGTEPLTVTSSELNLVDLAGSERTLTHVTDSSQRVIERAAINTSLLALRNVIDALTANEDGARRSHIPFRDSKLTRLLSRSLGGNCGTCVIATLSPAASAAAESLRTLRFACRASYVRTAAVKNVEIQLIDGTIIPVPGAEPGGVSGGPAAAAGRADGDVSKKAALIALAGGPDSPFFNGYITIPTRAGPIAAQAYGKCVGVGPLAIFLHGYPSSSSEWSFVAGPLVSAGYRVLLLDMPGFGRSEGTRFGARSELNTSKNGPVDVVRDVISFTGESGVTLIGYDWGAGIAISTALLAPGVIKRIVVFNATYTEQGKELSAVRCPASILWTKGDQFHPVAWANKLKDRLKTASLTIFPSGTSHESTVVTEAIVGAVVGKNAGKPAKTAGKPTPDAKAKAGASEAVRKERSEGKGVEEKEEEGKGRGEEEEEGKDAVARSSRFLRSRSSSLGARSSRPSIRAHTISPSRGVGGSVSDSIAAVAEFRAAWEAGALPKLYGAMLGRGDTSMHSAAVKLFSSLPVLSPASLRTPDVLVKCGAWRQAPVGFPLLSATPRFRPGESVLALAPVAGSCADPARYLKLVSGAGEPLLVTPHALYAGSSGDKTMVDVACVGGGYSRSAMLTSDFMRLNGPQAFKSPLEVFHGRAGSGVSDVLQFEDGIRCDYTLPLMRARLMEMALTMEDHVARINFEDTLLAQETVAAQLACFSAIRRVMNITPLQAGVDRRRDARSQAVAKLITYGQGHCHGMTSTTVACVLPFASVLGLDVFYRAGSVVRQGPGSINPTADQHHWVEVKCRPSNTSFVCDPSYDGGGLKPLKRSITAYTLKEGGDVCLYPNGQQLAFIAAPESSTL